MQEAAVVQTAFASQSRSRERGLGRYARLLSTYGFTSIIEAFGVRKAVEGGT